MMFLRRLFLLGILFYWVATPAIAQYGVSNVPPGLPLASSNLTFYVATTGSDSNPCTTALPCLTIQHVMNLANGYNWNNLYAPTINVANGTYTGVQVTLPQLVNCPGGGNIALGNAVTLNDGGTGWTFFSPAYSNWNFTGSLTLGGSYGGFSMLSYTVIDLHGLTSLTFSGALANGGITAGPTSIVNTIGLSMNTTTSSMGTLFYTRGNFIADNATVTFTNPISFPANNFVVGADSSGAFFAFVNSTFVNPTNVTAATPLALTNGAFFEANGSSLSGGVALTRANFPGSANGGIFDTDATTVFQPEWITGFPVINYTTDATTLAISNLSAGGHQAMLYEVGSGGFLGQTAGNGSFVDTNNGNIIYSWDTSGNFHLAGGLQFSAQTAYTFNAADSGISRLGAASLVVGNGTAGDFSGTLKLAHITATALTNSATTSAVCYNTSTGVLTYDGTIGTCTTSDERLKNMGNRIPDALNRLLQINGVNYTWKDPAYGTGPQIGVGAQTVERVFPELVQTGNDGYKSVDYGRLTAPIIEALRELKADNDNLRVCQMSWKCRLFGLK